MKLYFKCALTHIKSSMQYPLSFIFTLFYGALIPFGNIVTISFLFYRFGQIKGYTLYEVLFLFSVAYLAFSSTETILRGFDMFSGQIRTGGFDRMLTRPRITILQVACSEFPFARIGRSLVPAGTLVYSIIKLGATWGPRQTVVLILAIAASFALYSGLLLLRASLCFWTTEAIELSNILIDGGKEVASYPITVYRRGFAAFFTFIIPFACVNYYPLMYILGRDTSVLCALAPLLGLAFPLPCLLVWRAGVRRYESTGS